MDDIPDAMALLEGEVLGWDGVRAAPGRFDSVQYAVGRREIGHVHRDGIADLPLPRRIREEVLASGRAGPHRAGVAGFVSLPVRSAADVENAVALFRLNYERANAADAGAGEPTVPGRAAHRSDQGA